MEHQLGKPALQIKLEGNNSHSQHATPSSPQHICAPVNCFDTKTLTEHNASQWFIYIAWFHSYSKENHECRDASRLLYCYAYNALGDCCTHILTCLCETSACTLSTLRKLKLGHGHTDDKRSHGPLQPWRCGTYEKALKMEKLLNNQALHIYPAKSGGQLWGKKCEQAIFSL